MPYVESFANQHYQIGQEGTSGTGTTAGHILRSMNIVVTEELDVSTFKAPGRLYTQQTGVEKKWVSFAYNGTASFTEILYVLENLFGAVAPTTPGGATITRKRQYTPPLVGPVSHKTWCVQWGDTNDVKQFSYAIINAFNMKASRTNGIQYSGTGFAQLQTSGNTFTVSPTELGNHEMTGAMLNFYLDTAGASIGTTQQQLSIQTCEFDFKQSVDMYWDADRGQASWATAVDDVPAFQVKLGMNDNDNTRTLISAMKSQTTYFLRMDVEDAANSIESGEAFTFQWDAAIRLLTPGAYGNAQKVLYREGTFEVVEDATWGKSQQITSLTGEASL